MGYCGSESARKFQKILKNLYTQRKLENITVKIVVKCRSLKSSKKIMKAILFYFFKFEQCKCFHSDFM